MHISSSMDPEEFVKIAVSKYQRAKSPSDRKKVNVLVTMALRAKLISETDRRKFEKRKAENIIS